MVTEEAIKERLKRRGKRLFHREGQELEFKEQFNLAALAEYFRDFAAFANNKGGLMLFGVKDSPREPIGLSSKAQQQFEKVDPEKITGYLLEFFSSEIEWEQGSAKFEGNYFGAFYIWPSKCKPVIARKDEGKDQKIKNGEVYYRYGGRTQKIQSAELETIINNRIEQNNQRWIDLMSKIGRAGPDNAAILDTERGLIEKDDSQVLVLDDDLAQKMTFIKEGQFREKQGAPTLKLVGDITPVDRVEVVQRVRENLTKAYPYSAMEFAQEVQRRLPDSSPKDVWRCIRENGLKDNPDYSVYNFRNKKQEDEYQRTGHVPKVTPSIYNHKAVDFIVKVLMDEKSG